MTWTWLDGFSKCACNHINIDFTHKFIIAQPIKEMNGIKNWHNLYIFIVVWVVIVCCMRWVMGFVIITTVCINVCNPSAFLSFESLPRLCFHVWLSLVFVFVYPSVSPVVSLFCSVKLVCFSLSVCYYLFYFDSPSSHVSCVVLRPLVSLVRFCSPVSCFPQLFPLHNYYVCI